MQNRAAMLRSPARMNGIMTEGIDTNRHGVVSFPLPGSHGSAESPAGEARRDTSSRFGRSRQMADCLRSDLLYSEKRPRDLLFRVIEQIVAEHADDPVILSRLTREAAARARQHAETTGFAFGHWETVSRAVVKAMLCAGVLLATDGH